MKTNIPHKKLVLIALMQTILKISNQPSLRIMILLLLETKIRGKHLLLILL